MFLIGLWRTSLNQQQPRITICLPHWQAKPLITICLRSIRKHSKNYDIEVIVVDDGSKDGSLEYLRSLKWIRLIERPEETHSNWPLNVFTAYERGFHEATGDYFITMHSDVFVKTDDWLDPFLREMGHSGDVAGVGAWKLNLENPLYSFQKRVFGFAIASIKKALGKKKKAIWRQGHYPRDYCAMYRRDILLRDNLTFHPLYDWGGGGHSIAKQIWNAGYKTRMVQIRELAQKIVHIAHGSATTSTERYLKRKRKQIKVEKKVELLFSEPWVKALLSDTTLDY